MSPSTWLFDGWQGPLRTLLVGVLAYAALITALRLTGKRTLSKMNAFDLVVTVSLGSTLASALVTNSLTLVQAAAAFVVLVGLQFIVTWSSVRFRFVDVIVKSKPTLLAHRGELFEDVLKRERIAADEVNAALRKHGHGALARVEAVVLETDGTLTVVEKSSDGTMPALEGVRGFDATRAGRA